MEAALKGPYFIHDTSLKSVAFYQGTPDIDGILVYEVLRTESAVPLFLDDHMERLHQSANTMGVEIWISDSRINHCLRALISANNMTCGNIKLDFRFSPEGKQQFVAYELPVHYPSEEEKRQGVVACFQNAERHHPTAKIFNAEVRGQANQIIANKHVYETILVNHDACMTEGSRSNLFFISDGRVITAPDDLVLPGIVRKKIIDIIKTAAIPLDYHCLSMDELHEVEGAFISGTSPRLLPLRLLGAHQLRVDLGLMDFLAKQLDTTIATYIRKHR